MDRKKPERQHRVSTYGWRPLVPAMFAVLVIFLAGFALTDRWFVHEARTRDLARVQRYAAFARMLLEAQDDGAPAEAALERIRKSGLDQVDWLPADAAPAGKSPRSIIPGSSVEAWDVVRNRDGSTRGYVRITRMQDTTQLLLSATRWFALAAVLAFAAVFIAAWLGIKRLICAPIADMAQGLGVGPGAIAADPLAALQSAVGTTVQDLRSQLGKTRGMLDQHGEAVCLSTTDGHILEVNSAFCRILGKPRDQIVGTNRLDLVPASERTEAIDNLKRLGRRTPEGSVVHRVMVAEGGTRWMRWRDTAVFGTGDSVKEVLSFGLDITEQKQLAEKVAEMQDAFDQMQSLASTGSLTWDLTCDEMRWTTETFRLLSLDPSSVRPSLENLLATVAADDRGVLQQLFEKARTGGDSFAYEFRVILPDGSVRFLQSRAEVRSDPHTKLLDRLTCTPRDITDLRDAEAATKRELRLREAIEQCLASGIIVSDMKGKNLLANPAFCRMVGWAAEEVVGMEAPYSYWPEEEMPTIRKAFELATTGHTPPAGFELRFCRKNGERFDVLVNVAPLLDSNDRQIGWLGAVTDISSIQKIRRDLAEAEAAARRELTLRQAIENTLSFGIVVTDLDGNLTMVNPGFAAMTGWTREELLAQKPPFCWWPEEEIPAIQHAFELFLAGKTPREGFEMTFCRKDGTRFHILVVVAPLADESGKQFGWLHAVTDVTGIQQTRRQLVEANEILSVAAEVADAGVWIIEPTSCRTEWSRRSFAIHGDPDGRDPVATYLRAVPPAERDRSDAYLRQVIRSGQAEGRNEMDVVWPDGSVHRISSHFRVIREEKTNQTAVVGIHRDITGFLRREKELREANERIVAVLEGAEFGMFEHVVGVGDLHWSANNYDILGIDRSIADPAELFALWRAGAGDTFDHIMREVASLPPEKQTFSYECVFHPPLGEPRNVRAWVFIERDEEGRPSRFVGLTRRIGM